jgi:glycosyltransferase involved in cell wall biosynthesis
MSNKSLILYRGFDADRRMSMDIYADSLATAVKGGDLSLDIVRPASTLERFASSKLVMRYLRYCFYPSFVKGREGDLHHVLDHGYAHLHRHLKTNREGSKTCVTLHDLIPMLTWNGSILSATGRKIVTRKPWLNLRSLSNLNYFDAIVTVSNNSKNDIVKQLGISAEKITVIPPLINQIFHPCSAQTIEKFAEKYEFDRNCKWLMISGTEFYKNHETCLKVLEDLNQQHDTEFRLVKTGARSESFNSMVRDLGLKSKVRSIFLEDTKELAQLYGLVDCLLFPSLYEGFGMPVAEALACGTPVVTSNRGALPEVGGGLASVCDAGDVPALSKEVSSMIFDTRRKKNITEQGPSWVDQFREPVVGRKLESFYAKILNT